MDISNIPYSPNAEAALVGAALLDPRNVARAGLEPEDFYVHRLRWIWETISGLINQGLAADFVTICQRLDADNRLAEIGGSAYMAELINITPSSTAAESYAAIVRDKAIRRRMLTIANDLAKAAYDETNDTDTPRSHAMTDLAMVQTNRGGAVPIGHYLTQAYDDIVTRSANPSDIWGLQTGFTDFDYITGGLQTSEVMFLSGEPGIGKTILATQMGQHMAEAHHAGGIYSLEMVGKAVARRMASGVARIDTRKLKSGKLEGGDWPVLAAAMEHLNALPICMSDATNWTTTSLRADLSRLKQEYRIEWFIVDYLNLMMDGAGRLDAIEHSKVISRALKSICKDLNLAGIVIQSLNKTGMGGGLPTLSNLSGSSQVSFDADLVTFLVNHQPDNGGSPDQNLRTLIFGKGRELANPKKYMHLLKRSGYPVFDNCQTRTIELNERFR